MSSTKNQSDTTISEMSDQSFQSVQAAQTAQEPQSRPAHSAGSDLEKSEPPASMDSFPLFGELPIEAQGIIWDISNTTPRLKISNGVNITGHGEGRTIQVHIRQTPYFQTIGDVPVVGRQPVPSGRYEYRWRLWTSDALNQLDFISRDTWEEYQRRYPDLLELRDDPRSEVVRFDASRDTIYLDIQSLFALSDYATNRGEPGFGDQSYGHGLTEDSRKAHLIGFENIQRLAMPIPYPPERQGIDWLLKNIFIGIHPSISGVETLPDDVAHKPASDPRPSVAQDPKFPGSGDFPVVNRWSLRDFLLLQLKNIFKVRSFSKLPLHTDEFIAEYRAHAANREAAAREFFLLNPTPSEEQVQDDGPDPRVPCWGQEVPASGDILARYNHLLREFYDRKETDEDGFSDAEDDEVGMRDSLGEPSRRRHHITVARRALNEKAVTEFNKYKVLIGQAFVTLLPNLQRSWSMSQTDLTEARNMGASMGRFVGLGSIAGWPVDIPSILELGFSSPLMPGPRLPSDIDSATALANQDDDGIDEFGHLEKRTAALAINWYQREDKQERILGEVEEIDEQIDFSDLALWDPARWMSDEHAAQATRNFLVILPSMARRQQTVVKGTPFIQ